MSIVVAVRKDDQIVLGADTQSIISDYTVMPPGNHRATKVHRIGSSYLGATGWGLYENILEDFLERRKAPPLTTRSAIFRFFLALWKDLHERYTYEGPAERRSGDSPFGDLDASFLIVNPGGMFDVAADMNVTEYQHYYAVGSGRDFAFGALHALYESDLDAEALARRAVATAMAFDTHCGGEIETFKVRVKKKR